MAARRQAPPQDITLVVVAIGVAGMIAAAWYGFPGLPVLWLALIAAAWLIQPPALTGKKDSDGYPSPANSAESRKYTVYQTTKGLRASLVCPIGELMPGWPVKAGWLASVWAGALGYLIPVVGTRSVPAPTGRWLDALAAMFMVAAITGALRRSAGSDNPGVRIDSFGKTLAANPVLSVFAGAFGALVGIGVAAGAAALVARYGSEFGASSLVPHAIAVTPTATPTATPVVSVAAQHPGITIFHPLALWVLLAVGGAGLGIGVLWNKMALADWRTVTGARAEWKPRWESLCKDQTPVLIDHQVVGTPGAAGSAVVDTFRAPSHLGALEFLKMEPKIGPMLGAGMKVALLSCPDRGATNAPLPGTWSGLTFRIVAWVITDTPDVTDPAINQDLASLWIESSMAWTSHGAGVYPEPVLAGIAPITGSDQAIADQTDEAMGSSASHSLTTTLGRALAQFWVQLKESSPTESTLAKALAEESQSAPAAAEQDHSVSTPIAGAGRQLWKTEWGYPQNLGAKYIRENMVDQLSDFLGVSAFIDHRSGSVYVGSVETDADIPGDVASSVRDLQDEDAWRERWTNALKQGSNIPKPQPKTAMSAKLENGSIVHRLAFVVNQGNNPREYKGIDENLQTAMRGATFVVTTGWPDVHQGGRPGDRHPQALCLYWSHDPVPLTPKLLIPTSSVANQWVLAAIVNRTFATVKLPAPELVSARPLTTSEATEQIWSVSLRLYGGVTTAQVRGQGRRIAETLGISWVRVTDSEDGCELFMGGTPTPETLRQPEDTALVAFLDWEQAFLASGVVGSSGGVPQLKSTDHLPSNPAVSVLEFSLPPGLDRSMVRAAIPKLKATTGNAYIDVGDSELGPTNIRMLASRENPLPLMVAFNFEAADRTEGFTFATGVDGEPVVFTPAISPHVAIIGQSGSGKSVCIQDVVYCAAVQGSEVHIIDPMKAAADFQFVEPYARTCAITISDSAAVLRAVYAEVERRKAVNAQYGVGSYTDLPDDVHPAHILVVVDEFTSLITEESVPRGAYDDPELESGRMQQIALNNEKRSIATYIGKLAREARSAGVTLVLGTQKLMAKSLDSVPGGGDLKANLARILLGTASPAERMSALRVFEQAPDLGTPVPKGRGVWESSVASGVIIQTWFAPSSELADNLAKRIQPLTNDQKLDIRPYLRRTDQVPGVTDIPDGDTADPDEIDLGEMELSLDDLEVGEPEHDEPESDSSTNPEVSPPLTDPEPVMVTPPDTPPDRQPGDSDDWEYDPTRHEASPPPPVYKPMMATPSDTLLDDSDDWEYEPSPRTAAKPSTIPVETLDDDPFA